MVDKDAMFDELAKNFPAANYTTFCNEMGVGYIEAKSMLTRCKEDYNVALRDLLAQWDQRVKGVTQRQLEDALDKAEVGALCAIVRKYYAIAASRAGGGDGAVLDNRNQSINQSAASDSEHTTRRDRLQAAFELALKDGKSKLKRGRVMFVGASGVGKTSLLKRLIGERFDPEELSTVGVDMGKEKDKIYTVDVSGWKKKEPQEIKSELIEETARVTRLQMTSGQSDDYIEGETAKVTGQQPIDVPSDTKSKVFAEAEKTDRMPREDDGITYHLWDFGGQQVYHITHPIFLTWRAVFVLVFDLSKTREEIVEELDFWMMSIYAYAVSPNDLHMAHKNVLDGNESRPKVIVVGTHADDVGKEVQSKLEEVKTGLQKKLYSDMITGYFEVDNASDIESKFQTIRHAVDDQMKKAPFMKEEVPTRWVLFEDLLFKLTSQGKVHRPLSEVNKELENLGIRDQEIEAVLTMFHNIGKIVYFPGIELVILSPQWLNMMMTRIVAVEIDKEQDALDAWNTLEHEGILTEQLIDHVWKDHADKKDDILRIMEKFDLICEIDKENKTKSPRTGTGRCFFVPCLIKCDEGVKAALKEDDSSKARDILDIDFLGFLPVGFVHRLFVKIAQWIMDKGCQYLPRLGKEEIRFFINEIQLVLKTVGKEMKLSLVSDSLLAGFHQAISEFKGVLERLLGEVRDKWARGLKFILGRMILASSASSPLAVSRQTAEPSTDTHMWDTDRPSEICEEVFDRMGGEMTIAAHTLKIPEEALKEDTRITLKVFQDVPDFVHLKDDEVIATYGFQFFPTGLSFAKPVRLTIPHCFSLIDPQKIGTVLYYWSHDENEQNGRVKLERIVLTSKTCRVTPDNIEIFLEHFCGGIVAFIKSWLGMNGKWMSFMPFLPRTLHTSGKVVMELRMVNKPHDTSWEKVHKPHKNAKYQPAKEGDDVMLVKEKELEISCQIDGKTLDSKKVSSDLLSTMKRTAYFDLNLKDNSLVTLKVQQDGTEMEILFRKPFSDDAKEDAADYDDVDHSGRGPANEEPVSEMTRRGNDRTLFRAKRSTETKDGDKTNTSIYWSGGWKEYVASLGFILVVGGLGLFFLNRHKKSLLPLIERFGKWMK